MWEVRVQATGAVVTRGSTQDVATGALTVTEGILPSTVYEVRARPVVDRASAWTTWVPATSPANLIIRPDIGVNAVSDKVTVALASFNTFTANNSTPRCVTTLGAVAVGDIYFVSWGCTVTTTATHGITVFFRRRILNNGVWSAYVTLAQETVLRGGITEGLGGGILFGGQFEDVEFSLLLSVDGTGSGFTFVGNPTITYQRLVR